MEIESENLNINNNYINNNNCNDNDSGLNDSKYSSKTNPYKNIINKYSFKIILLGDSSVGKSSIFNRFINNEFTDDYKCTIGAEFKLQTINPDNNTEVNLHIWDTAGSEKYKSITKQYYHESHGIILIYDVTQRETFNNLESWINEIKNNSKKDIKVIIVGNKNDIEKRVVSVNEGIDFAKKYNSLYIDASAKNGTNIMLIFHKITEIILSSIKEEEKNDKEIDNRQSVMNISDYMKEKKKLIQKIKEEEKKKKNCC